MSFMKGFGDSFSRSFDREQEIAANERQDTFRMTYQELVRKREKREERNREDTKLANKAKSLVESYGQVPEEAWTNVYGWLQAGMDDKQIADNLARGSWAVKKSGGETKVVNEDASTVAQQTAEAGFPTGGEEVDTSGNPISGFFDKIKKGRNQRNQEYATSKIAETTGMTPEEVNATMADDLQSKTYDTAMEFTPGAPVSDPDPYDNLNKAMIELNQARTSGDEARIAQAEERVNALKEAIVYQENAKRFGGGQTTTATVWKDGKYQGTQRVKVLPDETVVGQDGKPIEGMQVEPITEQEGKDMLGVANALGEPLKKYTERRTNTKAAVRAFNLMNDIVERTNGAVLAGRTSNILQGAQSWLTDGVAAAQQISDMLASNEEPTMDLVHKAEALREKVLSEPGDDLATAYGLFEAQKALMAYYLAGSVDQDGRSLQEPERKMFAEIATGGVTVDKFQSNMANILMSGVRNIDQMGKDIYDNNAELRNFHANYKYIPEQFTYRSVEDELNSESDPDLQKGWSVLKQYDPRTGKQKVPAPVIPDADKQAAAEKASVTTPPPAPEENLPVVSSPAEAAKLEPGTKFKTPDGRIKIVPPRKVGP